MVPVAGILVMRALGDRENGKEDLELLRSWRIALPLICAGLISVLVMWADYSLAGTTRKAAEMIVEKYGKGARPLLFQGHWGFQYYMEQHGAEAIDIKKQPVPIRQIMATPDNNTNIDIEIMKLGGRLATLRLKSASFLTTMNQDLGVGFYSSAYGGSLPFAFCNVPEEKFYIDIFQ